MLKNHYDLVELDINRLLSSPPRSQSTQKPGLMLTRKIQFWSLAALQISGIWKRMVYANLVLGWFNEFQNYWKYELQLCRLSLPDFFYLYGLYRSKFQFVRIAANQEQNRESFLSTWQDPATTYLIFAYQYKLALHPISVWSIRKYIKKRDSVCEYGCGLAPITQNLARYYPELNLKLTGTDIPNILLHFARWKLQNYKNVEIKTLDPIDTAPLKNTYDVITCLTVLEHLPRPLSIVRHLHRQLQTGGYFIFDYISSDGDGLDTIGSTNQRLEVLKFIKNNFRAIEGKITMNGSSVKRVVCRKK
ncbi:MAG: class I SAM-dependent methyltransferase [bacterium]|nr:class I SAM-dependent methyltransferase [bacterium]